jgi:phosphatidylglycerol:prolipoprotein diacylglycerol transferase
MIAFTLFWRPVYRYGIAYAVTFLWWYLWLQWVVKWSFLDIFPKVKTYLLQSLDDFVMRIILAILLWGRLGHVFFYERNYYSHHLTEILAFHEGGMAFLGGVIGVVLMLLWIQWKQRFSFQELKVIWDLILCIVPLGIFLGRIANFLNQELVGKAIETLPQWFQQIANFLWLVHIYPLVDMIPRFNVNIAQAMLEWLVLLIIWQLFFWSIYKRDPSTGSGWPRKQWEIVSFFFVRYGFVRFLLEFTKDIPSYEYWWYLTISQYLSLLLLCAGLWIFSKR